MAHPRATALHLVVAMSLVVALAAGCRTDTTPTTNATTTTAVPATTAVPLTTAVPATSAAPATTASAQGEPTADEIEAALRDVDALLAELERRLGGIDDDLAADADARARAESD